MLRHLLKKCEKLRLGQWFQTKGIGHEQHSWFTHPATQHVSGATKSIAHNLQVLKIMDGIDEVFQSWRHGFDVKTASSSNMCRRLSSMQINCVIGSTFLYECKKGRSLLEQRLIALVASKYCLQQAISKMLSNHYMLQMYIDISHYSHPRIHVTENVSLITRMSAGQHARVHHCGERFCTLLTRSNGGGWGLPVFFLGLGICYIMLW